jgi:membrane protease subunit (stomatin/prohibitin family)
MSALQAAINKMSMEGIGFFCTSMSVELSLMADILDAEWRANQA